MRRFFFDPTTRKGETVYLSAEESRHISKVLRLKSGSVVELLDGQGTVFKATISSSGRLVEATIEGIVTEEEAGGIDVRVYQGVLKGEKMDTVVQKCTELGVTGMRPFVSSRYQGKLSEGQSEKKHERWQRIGLAACKQCMRLRAMQIGKPLKYSELLNKEPENDETLRLLFWEEETKIHLGDIPEIVESQSIILLLGPEGGFTSEEVEQAQQCGYRTVSLGERILRAETATLTAVSIVQYLTGNL